MRCKLVKENGFALVIVLIIFAVIFLLGTTILSVASSEHRFTNIDSKSQSSYYVAESGINYMLSVIENKIKTNFKDISTEEEFFQAFETEFLGREYEFNNFEDNFGEKPVAEISVRLEDSGENYRDYRIESTGSIGKSRRTVNCTITLSWIESPSNPIIDDLLFYTNEFAYGGNVINGINGTIVSDGLETHEFNRGAEVNISTMYFNGPVRLDSGSTSLGSSTNPGTIYINGDCYFDGNRNIYGDVRVNGNSYFKGTNFYGNVYVDGDVELGPYPTINENLFYTGELTAPDYFGQSILSKCIKVDSLENWDVPVRELDLRDDIWYENNGYVIKGNVTSTIPENARWVVDNYTYTNWQNIKGNVVIVSKGNITINVGSSFTGALIAPNGVVNVTNGGTTFNGVIVSKNGINFLGGGNTINLSKLQDFFSVDEIPVIFGIPNNGNDDNNGSSAAECIQLSIKSGIREK